MHWPLHKLEDLTEPARPITYGVVKPGPEDLDNGVKFIRGGDIFEGRLAIDSLRTITPEVSRSYSRTLLSGGELVVSLVGNPGHVAVVPKSLAGANLARQAGLVALRGEIDADFIKFFLMSPQGRAELFAQMTGSVQVVINLHNLRTVRVPLPPLPIQRRIAGILSAYDELIENSQRRIKILESMARALYREWFVHFRFPGHEHHPRFPSPLGEIPKGWEASTLAVHLASLESGKRPKGGIRDVDDGVPSIGAENINGIGQHDFAGEKFIPREFFLEMRKGVVRDRDVAIYKDGAYIGKSSYFRDGFPHSECCVNEHVFLLRASGIRLKQNALYLWLQEPDTVQTIRSKNANAAQPGINQQTVGGLDLTLPDSKTAAQFDQLVDPLLAEIINLAKKIQNLRRTRDLLLPRLLSGQIDVEAIA